MKEFLVLRFMLVGMGNTALGLGVIFLARQFLSDVLANLVGYLVVVPISFLTHRNLSFKDKGSVLLAFGLYVPTVLVGYAANFFFLTVGLDLGCDPYAVQAGAIALHVVVTYTISKWFVFTTREQGNS